MADPLKSICDDPLERRWVWISLALAIVMGVMLGYFAVANNLDCIFTFSCGTYDFRSYLIIKS